MTKREINANTCMYMWSMRNGYKDLIYLPYLPPEIKDALYKNRRRWTKFLRQHMKKIKRKK